MTLPRRLPPGPEERLRTVVEALPGLVMGQSRALRPTGGTTGAPPVVVPGGAVLGRADCINIDNLAANYLLGNVSLSTPTETGNAGVELAADDDTRLQIIADGWYQASLDVLIHSAAPGDLLEIILFPQNPVTAATPSTSSIVGSSGATYLCLATIPTYLAAGQAFFFGTNNDTLPGRGFVANATLAVVHLG